MDSRKEKKKKREWEVIPELKWDTKTKICGRDREKREKEEREKEEREKGDGSRSAFGPVLLQNLILNATTL